MLYIHEQYSDYERLLHANPQRGYSFFYSTLLNENLRNGMLTNEAALQAIFCGINNKGVALFPNANDICDLLVSEGFMDTAFMNYMKFIGYDTSVGIKQMLINNVDVIFSGRAACAAMLQDVTAMQAFVTDSTLWSAILANPTYFRRCMCSYYFCDKLARTPAKIADIRANANILTAFNTNKTIFTSTNTLTADGAGVYFAMIIGAGGKGGSGGRTGSSNCSTEYYDASSGSAGSNGGPAGKNRYAHYTNNDKYKNAGGGGGRGGVSYCAIRVKKGAHLTCTISGTPTVSGYDKRGTTTKAANNTQGQILPDIVTTSDSTSTTDAAKGYGGYGYGAAASGNNLLGKIAATAGTARADKRADDRGAGGNGVGAGGGGGAGGDGKDGGAGAPGCIGLYKGA